jgi:hypothetical protein
MSINNLFGEPFFIEGIGNIYPIRLIDWEKFESVIPVILQSEKHFETNGEYPLLDILIRGISDEAIVKSLEVIFQLALRNDDVKFVVYDDGNQYKFQIDDEHSITVDNFPHIRNVIMQQNILFEPKIYRNPEIQKWAEKVLAARGKNAPNITIEEMLSTVSVFTGKHYWDLKDYTMYQLKSDFNRICKIEEYRTQSMVFANPYADLSKFKMDHFAEKIDMYKNPYDDVFKDKSTMKKIL